MMKERGSSGRKVEAKDGHQQRSAFVKGKVDGRKKAIRFRDPVISTGNGMNPLSMFSLSRSHS